MRVLVTGGLGYLGSHLAYAFQRAGHDVASLDVARPEERRPLFAGEDYVRADLLKSEDVAHAARLMSDADVVVHLAALIDARESVARPGLYYRVNGEATLNALELAQRLGARRFIFASSAAVYGHDAPLPIREAEAPLAPENPYGGSKMHGERMVADVCRAAGMDSLSLRMFNLIGGEPAVGAAPRGGGLFRAVTEAMAGRRERVVIYGDRHPTPDGAASRDYVDVRDVARAYVLALQQPRWDHKAVNLGSGEATTVWQVIASARGLVGEGGVAVDVTPARPGELSTSQACVDAAAALIGWRPEPADLSAALSYEYEIRRRG
jgi:UDP-glucose 4-epimerase